MAITFLTKGSTIFNFFCTYFLLDVFQSKNLTLYLPGGWLVGGWVGVAVLLQQKERPERYEEK